VNLLATVFPFQPVSAPLGQAVSREGEKVYLASVGCEVVPVQTAQGTMHVIQPIMLESTSHLTNAAQIVQAAPAATRAVQHRPAPAPLNDVFVPGYRILAGMGRFLPGILGQSMTRMARRLAPSAAFDDFYTQAIGEFKKYPDGLQCAEAQELEAVHLAGINSVLPLAVAWRRMVLATSPADEAALPKAMVVILHNMENATDPVLVNRNLLFMSAALSGLQGLTMATIGKPDITATSFKDPQRALVIPASFIVSRGNRGALGYLLDRMEFSGFMPDDSTIRLFLRIHMRDSFEVAA
jgi:hypothetical protein